MVVAHEVVSRIKHKAHTLYLDMWESSCIPKVNLATRCWMNLHNNLVVVVTICECKEKGKLSAEGSDSKSETEK